jgi:hypothetical protein
MSHHYKTLMHPMNSMMCHLLHHWSITMIITRMWRACNLTSFLPCYTSPVDYPFASPHKGPGFNLLAVLMWNQNSLVSVVSIHWWPWHHWSLWPHLRRASSQTITRPSCWQCDNPTWSHTALLSQFHARCRSLFPASQSMESAVGGGTLWRACNLTSF